MTRLGAVFWIGLVLASGFTTFKVKYAVQEIYEELTRVRKQALAEQQEIRVLNAEWTYLNQPERLADLNRAYLQLAPMNPKQLAQRIDDLPLRAPATPTGGPDVLVASNAPAAAPPPVVPGGPPATMAALVAAAAGPAPRVRLAKSTPGSLDALIAQIEAAR